VRWEQSSIGEGFFFWRGKTCAGPWFYSEVLIKALHFFSRKKKVLAGIKKISPHIFSF